MGRQVSLLLCALVASWQKSMFFYGVRERCEFAKMRDGVIVRHGVMVMQCVLAVVYEHVILDIFSVLRPTGRKTGGGNDSTGT